MATTTVIGNVVTAVKNNIATIKTAIGNASTSAAGLMTAAQVTKLNGIADGATKNTIDSALSTTSTNAVQNKVVTAQINSLNSSLTNKFSAATMFSGDVDTLLSNACVWVNGYSAASVSGTLPYTKCHMLFVVIDASKYGYVMQFAFGPNKSTNRTYTVSTKEWSAWVGL